MNIKLQCHDKLTTTLKTSSNSTLSRKFTRDQKLKNKEELVKTNWDEKKIRSDCHNISNFVATNTSKANMEDSSKCRYNSTTKSEDKQGCYNVVTFLLLSRQFIQWACIEVHKNLPRILAQQSLDYK